MDLSNGIADLRTVAASGFGPSIRYSAFAFAEPNGAGMPEDLREVQMPPASPRSLPDRGDQALDRRRGGRGVGLLHGALRRPHRSSRRRARPAPSPPSRGPAPSPERGTAAGLAVAMHASCDASTRSPLRAYRKLAREGGPRTLQRIEHYGQFVALHRPRSHGPSTDRDIRRRLPAVLAPLPRQGHLPPPRRGAGLAPPSATGRW